MGAPTQKVAPSQKAEVGSAQLPKDGDRAHENARDPENAAARRKEASRANAASRGSEALRANAAGRRSEASRADEASRGNAAARAKEAAPSQKAEVGSAQLPKDGDRAHENARDPENAAARRKEASRANEASQGNAAARAKEAAPSAALRRAALDPAVDPPPRAEKREDPNRNAELAASADRRGNVRRARRSAS